MSAPVEELLFTAASAFADAEDRAAFLDFACRGDASLRERLAELLDLEPEADELFDFQPDVQTEVRHDGAAEEEGIGGRIGRYRLITRIGAGGWGVVYYAEQMEPVRRKVALKIVKLGMDTEAVIARFEMERQALAQMDHANVARVIDAGATVSGRPYFVMELVEGERITDFCDEQRLNIPQRLELFVQVCRAIQHAHQKGLIHRDIKPSNILVSLQDGIPVPKVIDFGIAKAAAVNTGNDSKVHFGQLIGTPAYMSPEQAQGIGDLDTRTDVYSLGVLLYELLCGNAPFDFRRFMELGVDEIRRIIREEEPGIPSVILDSVTPRELAEIAAKRRTDGRQLQYQVEGDLGWIVMKAMEKDRSRRYDTATGFAMDIQRYLKNEAVLARSPSRAYMLRKFVQRNKVLFAAGSVAIIALLAGFGTSTWMFFRERAARREEARLHQEADLREAVAYAAVKIKYNDLAGADKLLADVPVERTPSSLEAARAFGVVAYWNMQAGRMKEAAQRYTSMMRATGSADSSDLPTVSINVLPAAATVAYAEGNVAYEDVRRMIIERFSGTTNGVVAEQTLYSCTVLPADANTLQSMEPLARVVEHAIDDKEDLIGTDFHYTAWACLAMALWNYRLGDLNESAKWVAKGLAFPDDNGARVASTVILRAMIEQRTGKQAIARTSFIEGSAPVKKAFARNAWIMPKFPISWFEWIDAALLVKEADGLIRGR